MKPLICQNNVASEGASCALLEVHVGTLQFEHHPLFSEEHVLAQRLFSLYNQYRYIICGNPGYKILVLMSFILFVALCFHPQYKRSFATRRKTSGSSGILTPCL